MRDRFSICESLLLDQQARHQSFIESFLTVDVNCSSSSKRFSGATSPSLICLENIAGRRFRCRTAGIAVLGLPFDPPMEALEDPLTMRSGLVFIPEYSLLRFGGDSDNLADLWLREEMGRYCRSITSK